MHTLHYMAVAADSVQEAYEEVACTLLNEEGQSPADWSDWHVVGGGRWNEVANEDWRKAYEDDHTNMIISFKDNPDEFKKTLEDIKERRKNEMLYFMEHIDLERFKNSMQKFAGFGSLDEDRERFDMNFYYVRNATKLLADYYSPDSGFFDLINYTASMSYLYDIMGKPDEKDRLYLVPVDFHY